MAWVWVLAGIMLLVAAVEWWSRPRVPKSAKRIPAPRRYPIIGHFPQIIRESMTGYTVPYYTKQFTRFGDIFCLEPLNMRIIYTRNPAHARHFLGKGVLSGAYGKGDVMRDQYGEWMGGGIFVSDGDAWSKRREFAKSLFHSSSLRSHVPVFASTAKRLGDRFRELAKHGNVDVQDYFMRFTLDTFANIGFGKPLHAIEDESSVFNNAFDYIQMKISHRMFFGTWWRLFHHDKKYDKYLAFMNQFAESMIRDAKALSGAELAQRHDLLSRMVRIELEQQELLRQGETPEGLVVDEKCLRDFIMNFLVAGRDTTAMLLTWSLHYVAHNPELGEELLNEARQVLGADVIDSAGDEQLAVTYEQVLEMRHAKRFLMEVLRLHPPVAFDGLIAHRDDVLPDGYFVPKGSFVLYSAYHIHRRPELYKDPLVFNPHRFINNTPSPYKFLAFHGGPRTCLGTELAYLEARIALVDLLRRFTFRPVNTKDEFKYGVILTFKDGLPLQVLPRAGGAADAGPAQ